MVQRIGPGGQVANGADKGSGGAGDAHVIFCAALNLPSPAGS